MTDFSVDKVFSSGFAEAAMSPAPSTVNGNTPSDNISISVVDEHDYGDTYVSVDFLHVLSPFGMNPISDIRVAPGV